MRLSAGQHGNVRPIAVLAALGLEDAFSQVERTQLLRSTNDLFLGSERQREMLAPGSKGIPLTTQ
jgi:hypothetical protein